MKVSYVDDLDSRLDFAISESAFSTYATTPRNLESRQSLSSKSLARNLRNKKNSSRKFLDCSNLRPTKNARSQRNSVMT